MRHGCAAFLFLTAACGGTEPTSAGGLARVLASGELRWGADVQGGEPYVYEDPAEPGRTIGFEVEIAEAIAKRLGVRARFVQSDWSSLVPALERGTFDMILNGLEVTPARAGAVAFTRPYYIFSELLVIRKGAPGPRALDELDGRRVGTLASSLAWDLLLAHQAEAVAYEGVEEPYQDLEHGRLDAVLLDDIIAERYGLVKPTLTLAASVAEGHYAIAVRKSEPELHEAVDTALGEIIASGELRKILRAHGLDDPRQAKLEHTPRPDQAASSEPGRPLTRAHVWLFVQGAGVTLLVSACAMVVAIVLGLGLALARRFAPRPVAIAARVYVEIFRGTPVLLQLYVIYFGLPNVSQHLQLGALTAAILGLGLNYAAYESEIYRAGMEAVPPGQLEAAHALGMPTLTAVRRILVPQAMRIALPGVTNDFIALLKDSSLVSVITVVELTKRMTITAVDVRSWLLPGLLCAGLYLAMSYPLSRLSAWLEDQLDEGEEEET